MQSPRPWTVLEQQKAVFLAREGHTYVEIGRMLGRCSGTVHRVAKGKVPSRCPRLTKGELRLASRYYLWGWNDPQIASELGRHVRTVFLWRKRTKRKPNPLSGDHYHTYYRCEAARVGVPDAGSGAQARAYLHIREFPGQTIRQISLDLGKHYNTIAASLRLLEKAGLVRHDRVHLGGRTSHTHLWHVIESVGPSTAPWGAQ